MGKEESSSIPAPNRSFRKPPPSLTAPGAHHVGGPGDFGGQSNNSMPYYAKNGGDPRSAPGKKGVDRSPSNKSATSTQQTEESVDASPSPPRIPLEMDHFDPSSPKDMCRKHWIIPVVLMVITAILAVVIPVSVIMTREKEVVERPANTPAPIAEKENMTLAELQELVPSATDVTLQAILEDPLSPQHIAYLWATKDPNNFTASYEDWRRDQRFAMAVLYHAMDGPNWRSKQLFRSFKWLSYYIHECDWMENSRPHVRRLCNEEKQYDSLVLPMLSFVRGSFPPEIAILSHLRVVNFTGSEWGTNIDPLFAQLLELDEDLSKFLPSLEVLDLQDSQTTGAIPTFLGTLTSLTQLDLSLNHDLVSSIPSEIGLLTNLEILELQDSGLTGTIPSELGNLSALSTFSIKGNDIEQTPLPDAFCGEDHEPFLLLETDWCQSEDECCAV